MPVLSRLLDAGRRVSRRPPTLRDGLARSRPGGGRRRPRSRASPRAGPRASPSSPLPKNESPDGSLSHEGLPVPLLGKLGPTGPAPRANPYPEVTDPACRLPLPTLFCLVRGCSPWRPAAVIGTTTRPESDRMSFTLPDFQGPTGAHRTPRQARRFPEQQVPILGKTTVQGATCSLSREDNSTRGPSQRLRASTLCSFCPGPPESRPARRRSRANHGRLRLCVREY